MTTHCSQIYDSVGRSPRSALVFKFLSHGMHSAHPQMIVILQLSSLLLAIDSDSVAIARLI